MHCVLRPPTVQPRFGQFGADDRALWAKMDLMFKNIKERVWAFDAEWVPDPTTGRALYNLAADMPDRDVIHEMWQRNGATDENPQPFLKLVMCRVVSIAMVSRSRDRMNRIRLVLHSLPKVANGETRSDEASILKVFLDSVGKYRPQLVGFNSKGSDLRIFVQRGIVQGIVADMFCDRPSKPWDGADYFAQRGSDWNIDLMRAVGGFGRATPSLNELAVASGIPGKIDGFDGGSVVEAWLEGDIGRIVRYNECDALTTYLVWLRVAHFAGLVDGRGYREERSQLRNLLEEKAQSPANGHLARFLQEWDRLGGPT